jgi:tetratricopeptide (TPR) repeat protein/transcriptional regulator with XRE-family HTH domain
MAWDSTGRPPDDHHPDFADLLRRYRRRAGMTQEQLAQLSGLSVRTVRNLERRQTRPYRDSSRRLADSLRLPADVRATLERLADEQSRQAVRASLPRSPNQLPADPDDFTGREAQTKILRELLTVERAAAVAVVGVSGRGGIGKTSLAVHVAHQLRGHFADGQFYVNLRGTEPEPRDPAEVLASFLRALDVDGRDVPNGLDARLELYRARLADRRALIVLDDAEDERQVRPLLPGSPSCAVLVTSRAGLVGLEGGHWLELEMLTEDEAVALLSRLAGAERVRATPAATLRVVRLCEQLPLAVRIAGARLAARPHWATTHLAVRLEDDQRRLDELRVGDLAVRASLAGAYVGLEEPVRRTYRLLAQFGALDVPAWVAVPLTDLPEAMAEECLERLLDARLLDVGVTDTLGQVRYRLHELVRLYGRERGEEEDAKADRATAVARVVGAWLERLRAVTGGGVEPHRLVGGLRGLSDPLAWTSGEDASLVDAVETAARFDLVQLASDLAAALISPHFAACNQFEGWWRTHDAVLAAARRTGDRRAEARALAGIGRLRREQDRFAESRAAYDAALDMFGEAGDAVGRDAVHSELGTLCLELGEFSDALGYFTLARDAYLARGEAEGLAQATLGLGSVHRDQGRDEAALSCYQEAVEHFASVGDRGGEAIAMRGIGLVHRARGDLDEAARWCERAHVVLRGLGNRILTSYSAQALAKIEIRRGDLETARTRLDGCLATCRELGDTFGTALMTRTLGELELAAHRVDAARDLLDDAMRTWDLLGLPLWRARTLRDVGAVRLRAGDHEGAHEAWTAAQLIFDAKASREARELAGWRRRQGCSCVLVTTAG